VNPVSCSVLTEGYAGLQAQALGLAEAAGLSPEVQVLAPRAPWRWVAASLWPMPLRAVRDPVRMPLPELAITCGGVGAAVGAALHRRGSRVVQVQHPRMDPRRFDLVVANRHDGLTGPNVFVTRTALHRATPARLLEAAKRWGPVFAALPRPRVAVLVGGNSGRFRLGAPEVASLGTLLAEMVRRDEVGLMVTPSRRTDPAVVAALQAALAPLGAYVWDGAGENPYFGLLGLADAIIATVDSVSMVSEAVATRAPVMLAQLPGRSRRQWYFMEALRREGRVRDFTGRLEMWPVEPLDDTPEAAAEMRRRLGI
jgi:mitochondrial fission protein ELM1